MVSYKARYRELLLIYQRLNSDRSVEAYDVFHKHWNGVNDDKPNSNSVEAMTLALRAVDAIECPMSMEDGAAEYEEIMSLQQAVEG